MLRSVIVFFFAGALAQAAVWPEQFGAFRRESVGPAVVTDASVWTEFGLDGSEQADYSSAKERFRASAYRFRDPTGALAAFQWQRPADARPSAIGEHASETAKVAVFAFHNYLFRFEGRKPDPAELTGFLEALPQLDQSALPVLPGYLPVEGLVRNSERYLLGPASLRAFEPRIPPSVAAFHLGAEAQIARFEGKGGRIDLAIFSYPTPHIARERLAAFSALPGAMVKRSGPLVAVVLSPKDPDEAEVLLSKIQYQATLTWNEYTPTARDNIGTLILTIFKLTGLIALIFLVAGVGMGGLRLLGRRVFRRWVGDDAMILLHIDKI